MHGFSFFFSSKHEVREVNARFVVDPIQFFVQIELAAFMQVFIPFWLAHMGERCAESVQ